MGTRPYEGTFTVSIDPSSIPSFGGQPDPKSTGPAGSVVIPDQELVKQLLGQMELKFLTDEEGDLLAPWEDFRTYFMFRGEGEQAVFAVRTFYERAYSVDDKPQLHEVIDDWNRRTLWPKIYTHTHDDGSVRLIGEAQTLIGLGVGLEHFVSSTVSWVRASIEFEKWVGETLGLEKDADGGGADGGSDGGNDAPGDEGAGA